MIESEPLISWMRRVYKSCPRAVGISVPSQLISFPLLEGRLKGDACWWDSITGTESAGQLAHRAPLLFLRGWHSSPSEMKNSLLIKYHWQKEVVMPRTTVYCFDSLGMVHDNSISLHYGAFGILLSFAHTSLASL